MSSEASRRFVATVTVDGQGRTHVPVPFDPNVEWGNKPRHHVAGTLNGFGLRGAVQSDGEFSLVLGPAWCADSSLSTGDVVEVELFPEGPQRGDLAPDFAAALDADPDAGAFFDSLAQFYRKAYIRYIEATKRRPEQRPVRVAEVLELLRAGKKER